MIKLPKITLPSGKGLIDPLGLFSQTPYEANREKRESRKRSEAQQRHTSRQAQAQSLLQTGIGSGNVLSGTEKEQQGQLAGLNLGAIGYGQGLAQTGKDIQASKKRLEQRVAQSGADPISAALQGQKASAAAAAQRQLSSGGIRGGAAVKAVDAVNRRNAAEVAASLYGQQRQSETDLRNMLGNILSGTTSLMQGERAANIPQPAVPEQGGGFLSDLFRGIGL